jgi:hypothetical protein
LQKLVIEPLRVLAVKEMTAGQSNDFVGIEIEAPRPFERCRAYRKVRLTGTSVGA